MFCVCAGEGLFCWECNSKSDPNCGEPFKTPTIQYTDCNQRFLTGDIHVNATVCRKITQKVQGETRVIRSCGFYNPETAGTCISRAGTHLVFMHYCQCKGDGCNTSSTLNAPSLQLFAFILTLLWVASSQKVRICS
ncbi:protein quiver [Caerostris darwini]|uniref:Protein quiver n=1 Tax=Caerostris darwini TaxID=1538125 RepID=A0AAV4MZ04_9ARAC|nr:protein quiver [Caerostris darwini]